MNPKSKLTEEDVIKVATEFALGSSARELAQRYNVSRVTIDKVLKSPIGQKVTTDTVDTAVKKALNMLKYELSSCVPLAIQAIKTALEKGNMMAVTKLFEVLGVQTREEKGDATQSITVVLPGASREPKDISQSSNDEESL